MENYIRLREAAAQLGVCPQTLRSMVHRGELAAIRPGRRWIVFEAAELARFLELKRIGKGAQYTNASGHV